MTAFPKSKMTKMTMTKMTTDKFGNYKKCLYLCRKFKES